MKLDQFCTTFDLNALDKTLQQNLLSTFSCSTFFLSFLTRNPHFLCTINWEIPDELNVIKQDVKTIFNCKDASLEHVSCDLAILRQRIHCKLVFQHHHHITNFERVASIISFTAKTILFEAQKFLLHHLSVEKKLTKNPESLAIIAMGKLGANELNFSSDVDLVFVYPANQVLIRQSGKEYSVLRFYSELGQKLVSLLNNLTINGFIYRVDMRLRPFGDGSPLASDLTSFMNYLVNHARMWERYAYIKADIISEENTFKTELKNKINQFVYRHYNDYRALSSIREMKQKILTEMKQTPLKDNIKLGRGGIREIEFICQCFQLIYGGQNNNLQTQSLCLALESLQNDNIIPPKIASSLYQHYVFLRDVENSLQMLDDQQTHSLPTQDTTKVLLAQLNRFDSWRSLDEEIQRTRHAVSHIFDTLTRFNENELDESASHLPEAITLNETQKTNNELELKQIHHFLENHAFEEEIKLAIENLLFTTLTHYPTLVTNVILLIHALYKRQTYLFLLLEHHEQFVDLLALLYRGQRVVDMLIKHPFLLERALKHKQYGEVYLDQQSFRYELQAQLNCIELSDTEEFLECLRRFKLEQVFNIITSGSRGLISLMESSDLFSYLATVIIEAVLAGAWREVFATHKLDPIEQKLYQSALGIVAYGKLGGLELSVSSDLDLVFIYSKLNSKLSTRIFVRVIQKFVHFMQIKTYHGHLYEIDLRLRPDGENGLLSVDMTRYEQYLSHKAWTWEHQALTRARFIYGNDVLQASFNVARQSIVCQNRDITVLKKDILSMRLKMRAHLLKNQDEQFHLKQSPGGMIDIEFIAQFYALAYSANLSALCYYSDSIRIIQTMESAQLIPFEQAQKLIHHYCYYRDLSLKCYLARQPTIIDKKDCLKYANEIKQIWHCIFQTD